MKTKETPSYYGREDNPFETIKVIEVWNLGFNLSNALKYVSRLGKKDDESQELNKVRNYLIFEIRRVKKLRVIPARLDFLWPDNVYSFENVIKAWGIQDDWIKLLIESFYCLSESQPLSIDEETRLLTIQVLETMVKFVDCLLTKQK